jgi:hypothetical protein
MCPLGLAEMQCHSVGLGGSEILRHVLMQVWSVLRSECSTRMSTTPQIILVRTERESERMGPSLRKPNFKPKHSLSLILLSLSLCLCLSLSLSVSVFLSLLIYMCVIQSLLCFSERSLLNLYSFWVGFHYVAYIHLEFALYPTMT